MSCRKFEENISAYFDGELDEKNQNSTLEHLNICEQCGSYFKQFKMLQNKMNLQLSQHEAPAFIEKQLMQRIASGKLLTYKPDLWDLLRTWADDLIFRAKPTVRVVEFAVVFLFAILAGMQLYNYFGPFKNQQSEMLTEQIQPILSEDYVQNDLQDYFAKSSNVLQRIINSKITDSTQFSSERQIANELLLKSQLISHKLNKENQRESSELMRDLEPLLIDLAHFDKQRDRRSVDVWKSTIDNNNYISRINLAKTTQANYNQ